MKKNIVLFVFIFFNFTNCLFSQTNNVQTNSSFQKISMIISCLALLFSICSLIFNYYNQYLKKPKISILLSEKIKSFPTDGKLHFANTITFFNTGAQYGAVYKIKAQLIDSEKNPINLEWHMFMQDKNIGKEGEQFRSHSSFESWAETLIIQGRTAVSKKIQFRSLENFSPKIGSYILKIFVFSGTNKNYSCYVEKKLKITNNDTIAWEKIIKNNDPQSRITTSSIGFTLFD